MRDDLGRALNRYRQAVRTLWNCFFAPSQELASWDSRDALSQIQKVLFRQMVIAQVEGLVGTSYDGVRPFEAIGIRPASSAGVPILISNPRPNDHNRYWDHPIRRADAEHVDLRFIDFFDWSDLGFIDLKYYRVQIIGFEGASDVVGRQALVDVFDAVPFLVRPNEVSPSSPPG